MYNLGKHLEDAKKEKAEGKTVSMGCIKAGQVVEKSGKAIEADENADSRLLKWFNTMLNERQRSAVLRILHGYARPLPYVLFGPPGTGKTMTLVEAMLQLYTQVPGCRLLACAPSNSAADLLVQRLAASGAIEPGELVRLNAASRLEESIPADVLPFSMSIKEDGLANAAMYRVVVTTCMTAGAFMQLGLRKGHFTHCFIDEAGQATEPEALVAMTLTAGSNGQVVLAGDPLQVKYTIA